MIISENESPARKLWHDVLLVVAPAVAVALVHEAALTVREVLKARRDREAPEAPSEEAPK